MVKLKEGCNKIKLVMTLAKLLDRPSPFQNWARGRPHSFKKMVRHCKWYTGEYQWIEKGHFSFYIQTVMRHCNVCNRSDIVRWKKHYEKEHPFELDIIERTGKK